MASTRLTGRQLSVALVVLLGVAACTGGAGSEDPPESTTAAPTSFASPPDGGGLAVEETGFSSTPDGAVSYGAVVENTSRAAAVNSFVSVWLIDADGNRIDGPTSGEPWLTVRLARLLPGERIGLGATGPPPDREVAGVEVGVEQPAAWVYPLDGENWLLQPVVVRDVATERGADGARLVFTVDAAFTTAMVPGGIGPNGSYMAIFRDAAGAVVGGADCCTEPSGSTEVVTPGRSQAALQLDFDLPARADAARTEVYVLLG
jgi:hypothetical protein